MRKLQSTVWSDKGVQMYLSFQSVVEWLSDLESRYLDNEMEGQESEISLNLLIGDDMR